MVNWQEVLLAWISHEMKTRPDFLRKIKKKELNLIENPNLNDYGEGLKRVKILIRYRTYLSPSYFTGRNWSLRRFSKRELGNLLLPLDTGWKYISGGSYKAPDAADTMANKPDAVGKRYSASLNFIKKNYREISKIDDRLIVVINKPGEPQIVEGAHRLVAIFYHSLKDSAFKVKPLSVYVGIKKKHNRQ